MKINSDSICKDCKHFEHDCNGYSEFDGCQEWCLHKNDDIVEMFYDTDDDELLECEGFEPWNK